MKDDSALKSCKAECTANRSRFENPAAIPPNATTAIFNYLNNSRMAAEPLKAMLSSLKESHPDESRAMEQLTTSANMDVYAEKLSQVLAQYLPQADIRYITEFMSTKAGSMLGKVYKEAKDSEDFVRLAEQMPELEKQQAQDFVHSIAMRRVVIAMNSEEAREAVAGYVTETLCPYVLKNDARLMQEAVNTGKCSPSGSAIVQTVAKTSFVLPPKREIQFGGTLPALHAAMGSPHDYFAAAGIGTYYGWLKHGVRFYFTRDEHLEMISIDRSAEGWKPTPYAHEIFGVKLGDPVKKLQKLFSDLHLQKNGDYRIDRGPYWIIFAVDEKQRVESIWIREKK